MPVFDDFGQVVEFDRYQPIPSDWYVVVADVVDSTQAIQQGKYKQVNVLGAAIITAISKLFYPSTIPYIFAGDGIFACVPPDHRRAAGKILAHVRQMAKQQFGLTQVSGMVPLSDIREDGYDVRVARYYVSEYYKQAVFDGEGLAYAETLLRDRKSRGKYQVEAEVNPDTDLTNLECRWNHLESIEEEIICVLVQVLDVEQREEIYRRVVYAINRIYCEDFVCKPVQEDRVSLTFDWDKLSVEYKIRSFGKKWWKKLLYLGELCFKQLAGKVLMYFGGSAGGADWSEYKLDLERNTDYRKFDNMVRQVLSGKKEQRKELIRYLEKLYQDGKIVYGLHYTPTVMITCMVMDYNHDHFHFVDGTAGGYAAAAAQLKEKLNNL